MSVHSNHYESEDEYLRDLRYEYRTEQAGLYRDDEPIPFEPTCECCEYCKLGKRFVYDIRDLYGNEQEDAKPGSKMYLHKTNQMGYMYVCVRDIEHIKEINTYDRVCEDHGEIYDAEE